MQNSAVGKANLNNLKRDKARDNYLNGTKHPFVKHSQLDLNLTEVNGKIPLYFSAF